MEGLLAVAACCWNKNRPDQPRGLTSLRPCLKALSNLFIGQIWPNVKPLLRRTFGKACASLDAWQSFLPNTAIPAAPIIGERPASWRRRRLITARRGRLRAGRFDSAPLRSLYRASRFAAFAKRSRTHSDSDRPAVAAAR